jgi:hypothetical protein
MSSFDEYDFSPDMWWWLGGYVMIMANVPPEDKCSLLTFMRSTEA